MITCLYFAFTLLLLYRYLSISIDVSILLYGYFYFTLLYLSNNMIMYACLSVYGKDSDQFQTECAYLCTSQSED